MDLKLYEGIQRKMKKDGTQISTGCGFSSDNFQKDWDGNSDILVQDDALIEDVGTLSNADHYLRQSENFLNSIKRFIKNKIVKKIYE